MTNLDQLVEEVLSELRRTPVITHVRTTRKGKPVRVKAHVRGLSVADYTRANIRYGRKMRRNVRHMKRQLHDLDAQIKDAKHKAKVAGVIEAAVEAACEAFYARV